MRALIFRRKWFALFIVCMVTGYLTMSFVITFQASDNIDKRQSLDFRSDTRHQWPPTLPPAVAYRDRKRLVLSVNCSAILNGDDKEIEKAKRFTNRTTVIREKDYVDLTKNCTKFYLTRDYHNYQLSDEEKQFPLAYSILLYKDVEQAERLLHAIYTSNNLYCLHVDMNAEKVVHDAIAGIAKCLPNVFVASRQEYVVYAGFSRLQADLNCMQDLLHRGKTWKYFMNLPSQQFPIKTNLEIVRILKIYNGANDIEGITGKRRLEGRFKTRFVYKTDKKTKKPKIMKTNQKKEDPPHNATVVKGSAYGIFSREFVEFINNNNTARDLLDWFRDVYSPDEYYWATLQHNTHLGTPGAFYKGKPDKKPWLAVYANWGEFKCFGKYVRAICINGVGDLRRLSKRKELFVNKFYLDYEPLSFDCMEEWYLNRTSGDVNSDLDVNYYKSLPFIRKPTQMGRAVA